MVLDDSTKQQLDELAKQDYFSNEVIQEQLNSGDPEIREKILFYLQRRDYHSQSRFQQLSESLQEGGEMIGRGYEKTKQVLSPYGQKLVEVGGQIITAIGEPTIKSEKPSLLKGIIKPKTKPKQVKKGLPTDKIKTIKQPGVTLQSIGKEINVSKLTNFKDRQQIKADMNLLKPSRTDTNTFNSVLYDGIRQFNSGFHSNRFKRQNLFTDKESDLTTLKERPNKQVQGFTTLISGRTVPESLTLSKIKYNPVNDRFNKQNFKRKWLL